MKAILASAVVTLVASFAMAHGEVTINWPSVNGLSIDNACATTDTFRSLTPVKVCTATTTVRHAVSNQGEAGQVDRVLKAGEMPRSGEWVVNMQVCSAYGSQALEVSRDMTLTECAYYPRAGEASEPCDKFITKTVRAGLTFSVEKIAHYGEADQSSFFNFTVPACK